MPATAIDAIDGLTTSVAVKAPCLTYSDTNITLSGLQTFQGITLTEGDRHLCLGQTDPIENGIYKASTGTWVRAADFDGNRDAVRGTLVPVTANGGAALFELTTLDPVTIGTSALTFALRYGANTTYDRTQREIAQSVVPVSTVYPEFFIPRYGALADGSSDAQSALQASEDVGGAHVPRESYVVRPTDTSPFYFGNLVGFPVYRAVDLAADNFLISGFGSTFELKDHATNVQASDIQYVFCTDKNETVGTLNRLTLLGTSYDSVNTGGTNTNIRFAHPVGVRGVRYLMTEGRSSGTRKGYFSHIHNCEDVQILGHKHHKNTGGINLRYCDNVAIVGGVWRDFSECIDFDGTSRGAVVSGNAFASTSRANQCLDINGQRDGVFANMCVYNLGNIATIQYKPATPPTYADYAAAITNPTVLTPGARVILSNVAGSQIGSSSITSILVGNTWDGLPHPGFEPVSDVILHNIVIDDGCFAAIAEGQRIVVDNVSITGVATPVGYYGLDCNSAVADAAQKQWSDLDVHIRNLFLQNCDRGGLRINNARRASIHGLKVNGINLSGTTDYSLYLQNLHTRGAQVEVDGLDVSTVNISGALSAIPAWAPGTTYVRTNVVSNGGKYYRATSSTGVSAGSGGPAGIGTAITDNGVTWEYLASPFSVTWGKHNRVRTSVTFGTDGHTYTHGEHAVALVGDLAATGTVDRVLLIAKRKMQLTAARFVVTADVAADATNLRGLLLRSKIAGVETSIITTNTAAGLTALTPVSFDLTTAAANANVFEPGDLVYLRANHLAAGKALTGLAVLLDYIEM